MLYFEFQGFGSPKLNVYIVNSYDVSTTRSKLNSAFVSSFEPVRPQVIETSFSPDIVDDKKQISKVTEGPILSV